MFVTFTHVLYILVKGHLEMNPNSAILQHSIQTDALPEVVSDMVCHYII